MTHDKTHEDDETEATATSFEDDEYDRALIEIEEQWRKFRRTKRRVRMTVLSAAVAYCAFVILAMIYVAHKPSAIEITVKHCQQMARILKAEHRRDE